jgi:hypothetical protein
VRRRPMYMSAIAIALVIAACGGSTSPPTGSSAVQTTCPASIADALAGSCAVAGQACFPEYACGSAVAIATCRCKAGHFACVDVTGVPVAAGASPRCPTASMAAPTCPATAVQASLSACIQTGQLCTYPSRCASIPAYEQCQCVSDQLASGMPYRRFVCADPCEFIPPAVADAAPESAAPLPDSGTHDASLDSPAASHEASADAKGEAPADAGGSDAVADATSDR